MFHSYLGLPEGNLIGAVDHEFYVSIQLGISSSQLTFIFYSFPNSLDDDPIWLIYFRGVETTDQFKVC